MGSISHVSAVRECTKKFRAQPLAALKVSYFTTHWPMFRNLGPMKFQNKREIFLPSSELNFRLSKHNLEKIIVSPICNN